MNEPLDTQITESLYRDAATAPLKGAGFGDVRRRVRRRRQRHAAAAVVPAVVGTAWLGLHAISRGTNLPSEGAGATNTSLPSSVETTAVPTSESSTPTVSSLDSGSTGTTSTVPPNVTSWAVCVVAGADASDAVACQAKLGGGASHVAISETESSFVMPLDPSYQADAEHAAGVLGLPVRTFTPLYLPEGVDLTGTRARVVVVLGRTNPWCTVPNCRIESKTVITIRPVTTIRPSGNP